ncbi:hypothetical protein F2P81_002266 [Scophthalmus maximus]|uniref:Uncharacterized protein n=1 Tax=Scophthalmus maximus TaxID=52904 RepID=A0A6A4TGD9_SCOMX|nr:hypothetical protein F2P81_002266 [Scophthalmus maximus]
MLRFPLQEPEDGGSARLFCVMKAEQRSSKDQISYKELRVSGILCTSVNEDERKHGGDLYHWNPLMSVLVNLSEKENGEQGATTDGTSHPSPSREPTLPPPQMIVVRLCVTKASFSSRTFTPPHVLPPKAAGTRCQLSLSFCSRLYHRLIPLQGGRGSVPDRQSAFLLVSPIVAIREIHYLDDYLLLVNRAVAAKCKRRQSNRTLRLTCGSDSTQTFIGSNREGEISRSN